MATVTCPRPVTDPGPDRSRENPRPVTDPGPVTRSYPGLAASTLGVTACPREIRPGCPIFAKVINNAYTLTNVFELFCHKLVILSREITGKCVLFLREEKEFEQRFDVDVDCTPEV